MTSLPRSGYAPILKCEFDFRNDYPQVEVRFVFQARRASISLAGGVNHRLVMDYSPVGPEGRHIRYGRFVPALQA